MTSIPGKMKAVIMRETGSADVLAVADHSTPAPQKGELLIKVTAAGVNGPDLVQRRGHYPPPKGASELLGLEVSGKVVALGNGVTGWSIGAPVVALTNGGGYAEYVAVDAAHCLPVPNGVSSIDAAGLPETYFTVWSNVFFEQKLPTDGNFLIHGGAGGIGSTAIQLGKAHGLNIFTTVGNADDADFTTELGAGQTINFRDEDFVEVLRNAGGADIILDIIGGDYVARNIKAARHDARLIQLAFNAGSKVEINLMPIMLKRLSYTGSTLRSRPDDYKSAIAQDLAKNVWPMFASGDLTPVTHAVLPLDQASQAHEMMETASHRGKILLTP